MTRDEIDALAAAAEREPERRDAQRALARSVTALVHGQDQVGRAERAAALLFSDDLASAAVEDVLMVFDDAPSTGVAMPAEGLTVIELLTATKLAPSKSEAERLIKQRGVEIDEVCVEDPRKEIDLSNPVQFLLRAGKKKFVRVVVE